MFAYTPFDIELRVWLIETINATTMTISENRYECVIGPEGRSRERRRTTDVAKKITRIDHIGITVLLILTMFSSMTVSATKPSLASLTNPNRISFWT